MNVAQALAIPGVSNAPAADPQLTLAGTLVCTLSFAYIVDAFDDRTGVLLHADGGSIAERLFQCAPASGGSHVVFSGPCTLTGVLALCVLPMFPRVLHSISAFAFEGSDIIRNGDSWVASPSFDD